MSGSKTRVEEIQLLRDAIKMSGLTARLRDRSWIRPDDETAKALECLAASIGESITWTA